MSACVACIFRPHSLALRDDYDSTYRELLAARETVAAKRSEMLTTKGERKAVRVGCVGGAGIAVAGGTMGRTALRAKGGEVVTTFASS